MYKTTTLTRTTLFAIVLCLLTMGFEGKSAEASHSGRDGNALTSFFEDFSGVTPPDLPEGWSKAELTSMGGVHTLSAHNPYSPPNHVRMETNYDANATLILMTPVVTDFSQNWLRFYTKTGSTLHNFDVEVGYLLDPDNHHSFVTVETITVSSNQYGMETVFFDDELDDTDSKVIAFRFAPDAIVRQLFLDNITWETVETDEDIIVNPSAHNFGKQQTGVTTPEQAFSIVNDGLSDITVEPDDITLTGDDADVFVLNNLGEAVVLAYEESVDIGVAFAPNVQGHKEASLQVKTVEVPLNGEGADFTITAFPHFEDFHDVEAPYLPEGWGSIVYNPTWDGATVGTTGTTAPHSPPYHVRIVSDDNQQAEVMLTTPPIDDLENKRIRFWSKCNSASNIPDLIIGTMSDPHDASTFTEHVTIEAYADLTEVYQQFVVKFEEVTQGHHYIAFRHGGTPSFARTIFVDDFMLEEIPDEPLLVVEPESFDFGKYQENTQSLPYDFILRNEGVGELILDEDDFVMTGQNPGDFLLEAIDSTIALDPFETDTIRIAFSPQATGHREAILNIDGTELLLQGEGIDASIVDVPFTEDFDDVNPPALPLGWTSIVHNPDYDGADVSTTSEGDAHSAPNHVRLVSNDYDEAEIMLISPPVHDLNQREIHFYAKGNQPTYLPDLVVGSMSDPSDISTFTPLAVISGDEDLSQTYASFTVPFTAAGLDAHIAFRHGGTPDFIRTIYIDDITIEELVVEPEMVITPDSHDFGTLELGEESEQQEFAILNDGGGTLVVGPDDIEISGADDSDFVLYNLEQEEFLLGNESTSISVVFSPESAGEKQAVLSIKGEEVPLTGNCIDTTVSEFPWSVDFEGVEEGDIPEGWHSDEENWGVSMSSHAGGTPPEMNFSWSPAFEGTSTLSSPVINTSGYDEMMLSFKHHVSNFGDPGSYTLRVVAIAGDNENTVMEWIDPEDIPAEDVAVLLNADDHGIGSDSFRLVWVFEGNTTDIYDWFIDDIYLGEEQEGYTVTFHVDMSEADGFDAELHDVYISGGFGGDMEWNVPGDNPDLVLSRHDGSMMFFITLKLEEGEYEYKYASDAFGEGWDGEEWPGAPNRVVDVDGDTETDDTWGIPDNDDVQVTEPAQGVFTVYPNPAGELVHIESDRDMEKILLIDILGQVLRTHQVQANNHTIYLADLREGMYFIQIVTTSGNVLTGRLQVAR